MQHHLFTWKPTRWSWTHLQDDVKTIREGGSVLQRWSCGRIKKIKAGSTAFLLRLGSQDPGLIGMGLVDCDPFSGPHWDDAKARAGQRIMHVNLELQRLDPRLIVPMRELKRRWPDINWTPQQSGTKVTPSVGSSLQALIGSR